MRLNRRLGNVERLGDGFHAVHPEHGFKHADFARGEPVQLRDRLQRRRLVRRGPADKDGSDFLKSLRRPAATGPTSTAAHAQTSGPRTNWSEARRRRARRLRHRRWRPTRRDRARISSISGKAARNAPPWTLTSVASFSIRFARLFAKEIAPSEPTSKTAASTWSSVSINACRRFLTRVLQTPEQGCRHIRARK